MADLPELEAIRERDRLCGSDEEWLIGALSKVYTDRRALLHMLDDARRQCDQALKERNDAIMVSARLQKQISVLINDDVVFLRTLS